jgi:hypothetical protein
MPSIGQLLVQGFLFGAVALSLAWFRWWLGIIGLAFAALMLWGTFDLWGEPHMREAVLIEQGLKYFVISVIGALLVMVGSLTGAVLGYRRFTLKNE